MANVPDINFPNDQEWRCWLTGDGSPVFQYDRNGKSFTALILGPFTIGADNNAYIIDMQDAGLTFIRNRIGANNIAPLVRALNNRRQVRRFTRSQGWILERNSANEIINVNTPTLCGRTAHHNDGDDRDSLPALPSADME
jgi:hypothetical protein